MHRHDDSSCNFRNKSSEDLRACAMDSSAVRDAAQMCAQRFQIAVILREHRGELRALRRSQPHATDRDIQQKWRSAIRPYTEIYRQSLAAGHLGAHDIVARRMLARGGD